MSKFEILMILVRYIYYGAIKIKLTKQLIKHDIHVKSTLNSISCAMIFKIFQVLKLNHLHSFFK